MGYIRHLTTSVSGADTHVTHISDLALHETAAGVKVYSASGRGGGVQVRDAALTLSQEVDYLPEGGLGSPTQFVLTQLGAQYALLLAGPAQDGLSGWWLDSTGQIAGRIDMAGPRLEAMTAIEAVALGGETFFFSAARNTLGITTWRETPQGNLSIVSQTPVGEATAGNDIFALEHIALSGRDYLLALSLHDNSLRSFELGANGSMQLVDSMERRDGFAASNPTLITKAVLGDSVFVLVGSTGSSTITVSKMEADGTLTLVEQVGDDLNTRFQSISVLEAIVVDGKAYVVAGGSDDGLSLLTLLPDGRLLHLEAIADDLEMALSNPSSVVLAEQGGKIALYTVGLTDQSFGESGIGRFEIDQNAGGLSGHVLEGSAAADELEGGAGADQILGGAGDDRLNGGAGADIILDGAGSDRMWGGAGADIFVLSGDGENDFIEDFELGVDRIDMSDMGRFYSFEALAFQSKNYGAIIGFGGETLTIKTVGKVRLEAEDFQYADLFDLGHISIDVLSDEQLLPASPGPSVLTGGTELAGVRNHLGMDLHIGGAVDPIQDAAAASVYRLYQATLDRAPDRDGHRNWTEALLDGRLDLESAAGGFVGSREFQNVYGDLTDYSFVTQLYNNVLDRAPDQAGLENWMGALANGFSRAQVVMGFSESREFVNATFQKAHEFSREGYRSEWTDDVFRLYRATFDRTPDAQGLQNWADWLAGGQPVTQAATHFVASAEFQKTYGNLSDAEFITLLYNNVLERAPDQGGFENWTGALASGMSRGDVVSGFAQSAEFRASTTADVTAWVRAQGVDDILDGGAGRNVLFGGMWTDSFVFDAQDDGSHEVVGLEVWDQLVFTGFGYFGATDLRNHLSADGRDTVFQDQGVEVRFIETPLDMLYDDQLFGW